MGRIAAGNLTERIALSTPGATVPDGRGGQKPGPTTEQTVRASVRVLSGLEVLRLGQTEGSTVAEFTIRYKELTTQTQVTWKGKTLGVRQVVHDPRKEFTVLTCMDNGRG